MRNNFDDIFFYFKKSDDYQITNYTEKLAVIVNKEKYKIAQIYRTSANNYEVITASQIYCDRYCRKSFKEALKEVTNFFNDY